MFTPRINATRLTGMLLLGSFTCLLTTEPLAVKADAFRPPKSSPLEARNWNKDGKLFMEPKEDKGSFTPHEDRLKRFVMMYEDGLEKKEPAHMTMIEAREAIGRIEAKMGKFNQKFALVVVRKLNDTEAPFVAVGTFGKMPAVLVTFNGTVCPVIAHGMGMMRIGEVNPKAPVWLRAGGARIFVSADGFDARMMKVLEAEGGPASYKDADRWVADEKASHDQKLHALATGWMLTYHQTEVCPKRLTVAEVLNQKSDARPDPEAAWKEVLKKVKKEKLGE